MRAFNEYRMIDILSKVDISAIEDEVPDADLVNPEMKPHVEKAFGKKKKIAVASGIAAAGSIMLTGAIYLLCRKHVRHAA